MKTKQNCTNTLRTKIRFSANICAILSMTIRKIDLKVKKQNKTAQSENIYSTKLFLKQKECKAILRHGGQYAFFKKLITGIFQLQITERYWCMPQRKEEQRDCDFKRI